MSNSNNKLDQHESHSDHHQAPIETRAEPIDDPRERVVAADAAPDGDEVPDGRSHVSRRGVLLTAGLGVVGGMSSLSESVAAQDSSIEITDWNDLAAIGDSTPLDGEYVLQTDLDAETAGYDSVAGDATNDGDGFAPIGQEATPFTGTFDGQDNTIAGLVINRESDTDVGLFGVVEDATIENLRLFDVDITGDGSVGGLAGDSTATIINTVSVAGTVTGGSSSVGGLAGDLSGGSIVESYAAGTIDAGDATSVGGLVGLCTSGDVIDSYALADVTGSDTVGGIAGGIRTETDFENPSATIERTYAAGSVTVTAAEPANGGGGLAGTTVGTFRDVTVELIDCYWDTQSTAQADAIGFQSFGTTTDNLQGLSTSDMQGDTVDTGMAALDFAEPDPTWRPVVEDEETDRVPQADGYPILASLDTESQLDAQDVESVAAPNISIRRTDLSVTPPTVDAGADVEVSLDLTNTGNRSTGGGVTISVDGDRRLSQVRGPIAPGETQSVTFTLTLSEPGERTISVAGVDETATVTVAGDAGDSSVTIEDQQATGEADTVTVASATAPEPYVIAVHEADDSNDDALSFDIRGVSEPFAAGASATDVTIELDEPITQSQNVTAMLHAVDEAADDNLGAPLTVDGEPVSDTATLTVNTEGTDLERFDQDDDGELGFGDVLDTITAHNDETAIGGEPVSFEDVLDVIAAHNGA